MNVRIQRTLLNWRWWVVMPVFAVLLPLAIVTMLAEAVSDGIAKITSALMAWTRAA